jgi:uncharacterized protein YndB with AHSA1/START domain
MPTQSFVYTIHVHTSPERLWQALTEPRFTRRHWGAAFETDWQAGSTYRWQQNGVTIDDPGQVILESKPPRRLSYTWHAFTPEWAEATGFSDEYRTKAAHEPRSKVTLEVDAVEAHVKLTLVHDGFEPGSTVLEAVSDGWPLILAELKTVLENDDSAAAP